jgi:hypothetical protein
MLFSIILSLILPSFVYGVGIGQYNREKQVLFQPGMEKSYGFQLSDSLKINAALDGDLAQYAVIDDPLPGGPPRNIEVNMKLPDFLEPGVHTLYITAMEVPISTATIGGISSVRVGMEVFALYPGKRPLINGLTAKDVNMNDTTSLGLIVTNQGEETIEQAYGNISVYSPEGVLIAELKTGYASIGPYETKTIEAPFDTSMYDLKPGNYKIIGYLSYDNTDYNGSREGTFIIGQMNINIIDYTKELFTNSTNKFLMTLESDWSGDIDDIYARIVLPNGKIAKTPNTAIKKVSQGIKANAEMEAYIETGGLPLGPNEFAVNMYYKNRGDTKKIIVNIIEGTPPEIEKPGVITPTMIFAVLSISILLFVAVYFLVFRKGDRRAPAEDIRQPIIEDKIDQGSTGQGQYSAGDIKPPSL